MPRNASVPDVLRRGVFTIGMAEAAGVTVGQLRSACWTRVAQGWYRWAECPLQERALLFAIAPSLPPGSAFWGPTAARLYGLDAPQPPRPEVVLPAGDPIAKRAEARVHRLQLREGDVVHLEGLPVTSPLRTCFDLAGHLHPVPAVVAIDMALHAGLVQQAAFAAYVAAHRGVAGVVGARRVLELVEPKAESPMETQLRLLLVRRGLPRPQAQVELFDEAGVFAGRLDLYYPEARLGIEYDGENHRERLISDDRRQNRLQAIGVQLLRYTASDLRERPDTIVREVRRALSRGPFVRNPQLPGAA